VKASLTNTLQLQLSSLLEYKNDIVHLQSSHAMQRSLQISEQLAVQNHEAAKQMRADSRSLKALSLIATIYLPASLVAVSISHPLVVSFGSVTAQFPLPRS